MSIAEARAHKLHDRALSNVLESILKGAKETFQVVCR